MLGRGFGVSQVPGFFVLKFCAVQIIGIVGQNKYATQILLIPLFYIKKEGNYVENRNLFAKNLKVYLELTGMSYSKLAKEAGVSKTTVCNIINGKGFRGDTVEQISIALGIPISDLMSKNFDPTLYFHHQANPPAGQGPFAKRFYGLPTETQGAVLNRIGEIVELMYPNWYGEWKQ